MSALEQLKPERLFIGVAISATTRDRLVRQLPKEIPGRPVPVGNWHFTLRFLGSTTAEVRDRLIDRLHAIDFGAPFDITFDSLGAFPNPRRARVMWIGVGKGKERLEAIAAKVESAVISAGFTKEARSFKAHLTISRLDPAQSVVSVLSTGRKVRASMTVDEVVLYRSELGKPYSRYTAVETFPLR